MSEPPVGIISYRKIQFRRGTAEQWAIDNPILDEAEPGYDTTNGIFKIGDGTTRWESLASAGGGSGSGGVTVSDTAPEDPTVGQQWFSGATGTLAVYFDGDWVAIGGGSGGQPRYVAQWYGSIDVDSPSGLDATHFTARNLSTRFGGDFAPVALLDQHGAGPQDGDLAVIDAEEGLQAARAGIWRMHSGSWEKLSLNLDDQIIFGNCGQVNVSTVPMSFSFGESQYHWNPIGANVGIIAPPDTPDRFFPQTRTPVTTLAVDGSGFTVQDGASTLATISGLTINPWSGIGELEIPTSGEIPAADGVVTGMTVFSPGSLLPGDVVTSVDVDVETSDGSTNTLVLLTEANQAARPGDGDGGHAGNYRVGSGSINVVLNPPVTIETDGSELQAQIAMGNTGGDTEAGVTGIRYHVTRTGVQTVVWAPPSAGLYSVAGAVVVGNGTEGIEGGVPFDVDDNLLTYDTLAGLARVSDAASYYGYGDTDGTIGSMSSPPGPPYVVLPTAADSRVLVIHLTVTDGSPPEYTSSVEIWKRAEEDGPWVKERTLHEGDRVVINDGSGDGDAVNQVWSEFFMIPWVGPVNSEWLTRFKNPDDPWDLEVVRVTGSDADFVAYGPLSLARLAHDYPDTSGVVLPDTSLLLPRPQLDGGQNYLNVEDNFDRTGDLNESTPSSGGPAMWAVEEGALTVVSSAGGINQNGSPAKARLTLGTAGNSLRAVVSVVGTVSVQPLDIYLYRTSGNYFRLNVSTAADAVPKMFHYNDDTGIETCVWAGLPNGFYAGTQPIQFSISADGLLSLGAGGSPYVVGGGYVTAQVDVNAFETLGAFNWDSIGIGVDGNIGTSINYVAVYQCVDAPSSAGLRYVLDPAATAGAVPSARRVTGVATKFAKFAGSVHTTDNTFTSVYGGSANPLSATPAGKYLNIDPADALLGMYTVTAEATVYDEVQPGLGAIVITDDDIDNGVYRLWVLSNDGWNGYLLVPSSVGVDTSWVLKPNPDGKGGSVWAAP